MSGELRITHFPYCLRRQPDGRYVLLNRNYKPVGFMTGGWVRYEDYPVAVHLPGLTPALIAEIDCGRGDEDCIYLYSDGSVPTRGDQEMLAYLGRLARLMALRDEPQAPG